MGEADVAAQDSFEQILVGFGQMKSLDPRTDEVQAHVKNFRILFLKPKACVQMRHFCHGPDVY